MDQKELLGDVKRIVLEHDPKARVVLYGSRARGDATEESDWDLLILSDAAKPYSRRRALSKALYEVEFASGQVLCPVFYTHEDWNSPLHALTPYHQNVELEGIAL